MQKYKWLLFDVDHTLFDFDLAELKALANSFAQFRLPYNDNIGKTYRTINQQIWQQLEKGEITPAALRTTRFLRLFHAMGIQAEPEPFSDAYLSHLANCGDLLAGTEEAIEQLSQTYRLGLITNGLSDVQRPRLAASPLQPYFETFTISDEVGYAKPDVRIFEVAFAEMGNPAKSEVLIIGDSLTSDMQGGLNYNIDTCWFNPHNKPNSNNLPITYEIQHLSTLPKSVGFLT